MNSKSVWVLGFNDFLVLNFLGLWLGDLMILLGLKNEGFEIYDIFFLDEFFGFFVCLFLKKISGFARARVGRSFGLKFLF